MTDITPDKLALAREWAKTALNTPNKFPKGRAAAEVITALPDEWIDADRVRAIIQPHLEREVTTPSLWRLVKDLEALLPAPTPRTLADMTEDEREACQWMQADFTETEYWHVITAVAGEKSWLLRQEDGSSFEVPNSQITPLPDLPRLEWPASVPAPEEDVSIIPPKIDTSTGYDDDVDMTPEHAPDGYYLVRWWGEEHPVPAEKVQGQWWVIGKPTMLPAKDVLIVSRLVPEVEE